MASAEDTECASTTHDNCADYVHSDTVPFPATSANLIHQDVVVNQLNVSILK